MGRVVGYKVGLDKENASVRHEPASTVNLGKDENGPPRKESWSYASVIGMLLYLSSNFVDTFS